MLEPAPGVPSYQDFIPELWVGPLLKNFYDATVLGDIANTDYEGVIKKFGDKVHIRQRPEITIRSYRPGQRLAVEHPDKPEVILNIDHSDYFNVICDDITKTQTDIDLMQVWSEDASMKMKEVVDARVLEMILPDIGKTGAGQGVDVRSPDTDGSGYNQGAKAGRVSKAINLGTVAAPVTLNSANVVPFLVSLSLVLDEQNCPKQGRWVVVPDSMAALIQLSQIADASVSGDGTSTMRNGRIGMVAGLTIYQSHLLHRDGSAKDIYNVIAGTKEGLTFAWQMTQMDTLKSEQTFGQLVRGLQLYGFQVVKPEAMAHARVKVNLENLGYFSNARTIGADQNPA